MKRLVILALALALQAHIPGCGHMRTVTHTHIEWHWTVGYGAWHNDRSRRSIDDIGKQCPTKPPPDGVSYETALDFFLTKRNTQQCANHRGWKPGGPYEWIDNQGRAWRSAYLTGIVVDRITTTTEYVDPVCLDES